MTSLVLTPCSDDFNVRYQMKSCTLNIKLSKCTNCMLFRMLDFLGFRLGSANRVDELTKDEILGRVRVGDMKVFTPLDLRKMPSTDKEQYINWLEYVSTPNKYKRQDLINLIVQHSRDGCTS